MKDREQDMERRYDRDRGFDREQTWEGNQGRYGGQGGEWSRGESGRDRTWQQGGNVGTYSGEREGTHGTSGGYGGYGNAGGGMGSYGSSHPGFNQGFGGGMGSYGQTGRYTGRGPKGYKRSDERIREDINDRLTQHPDIDAFEIEVEVNNGQVVLRGTIANRHEKRLAEDIVENVSGVNDVRNELRAQQGTGALASAGTGSSTSKKS